MGVALILFLVNFLVEGMNDDADINTLTANDFLTDYIIIFHSNEVDDQIEYAIFTREM